MLGAWETEGAAAPGVWRPGDHVTVSAKLRLTDRHLEAFAAARKAPRPRRLVLLVTAERTFDSDGWLRLPSDERMSTLLTPAGLAIEGGVQGAVTNRFGYPFRTPLDLLQSRPWRPPGHPASRTSPTGSASRRSSRPTSRPASTASASTSGRRARTALVKPERVHLRPGPTDQKGRGGTYFYSPVFPASGRTPGAASRRRRIAAASRGSSSRGYNSNGYRGVVADEDRGRFAISDRNIINDEVVLPLNDGNGEPARLLARAAAPVRRDRPRSRRCLGLGRRASWRSRSGPDGTVDLGTRALRREERPRPDDGRRPLHRLEAAGLRPPHGDRRRGGCEDLSGRRYEAGGTYRFWIAKRMTMATATFQGMPYPVGTKYGRDIGFSPPSRPT